MTYNVHKMQRERDDLMKVCLEVPIKYILIVVIQAMANLPRRFIISYRNLYMQNTKSYKLVIFILPVVFNATFKIHFLKADLLLFLFL